jgi:hypothetical protein
VDGPALGGGWSASKNMTLCRIFGGSGGAERVNGGWSASGVRTVRQLIFGTRKNLGCSVFELFGLRMIRSL